jgi:DNA topoisomerase-1
MGLIESVLTVDSKISEPDMTAELEVEMDSIAEKRMSKDDVVNRSRKMLHSVLDAFKDKEDLINTTIKKSINMGDVIGKCPEHKDSDIVLIKDRMNIRIMCTVEGCKNDFRLNINGLIQPTEKTCPECGLPQIKVIRRGQSPETKCIDPKCKFNTERDNMGKCPSDSGNLIVRQSRYGKRFLGCSNYPDCTVTYPLPQMGVIKFTGDICQYCGSPILVSMRNTRVWKFCPKMDCQFNKKKEKVAGDEKKSA